MEAQLLGAAVAGYGLAGSLAVVATVLCRRLETVIVGLLAGGLVAHTASLALRWDRVGHGPFISMFEVLSSNVWSLTLVFLAAYLRVRAVRPAAAVALPFIFVLMAWMLVTHPDDGHFPATYRTLWLYAHVGFGKVFLGSLLVAAAVGVLMVSGPPGARALRAGGIADEVRAEHLALRFLALAFVFESLMLVTGAIWAQDAWGRYWAWDPLETWSFLTWLALAALLHARFTLRLAPRATAIAIAGVFVLAILTFFGLPFVSTALHKGAI
ncbi:MAG: cytochrome c biogenesis protein CcsA [Betaproteobacteria bacterium]|nr:cytochrome c biogenesis protein CcsA [Betaproteobacteria bacterium]